MRILSHNVSRQIVLLALVECGAGMLSFYGGAFTRFGGDLQAATNAVGLLGPRAMLFVALGFFGLLAVGLYRPCQRATSEETLVRILTAVLLAGAANAICYYLVPQLSTGRGALALALIIYFFSLCIIRANLLLVADSGFFRRRVLVIGGGKRAQSIAMLRRQSDQRNFRIVGYLSGERNTPISDIPCSRLTTETLRKFVLQHHVDEIVVAMDDRRDAFPTMSLLECRVRGVMVTDLISFLERETGKINLEGLYSSWLIFSPGFRRGIYHTTMKRCSDLASSLILFLLMSPLLVLTGLAIFAENKGRGPILYRQQRIGFEGRIFNVLKFRSMRVDAEADGRVRWAVEKDDRVTRVGAVIRRFHIDELPQIINVLRGEMSFIGPRPERPEFVTELADKFPFYAARHCVKPGIAGWAQLCYPYGDSVERAGEKLQYDLYYVKNQGFIFDIVILFQTLEVVLWGRSPSMAGGPRDRRKFARAALARALKAPSIDEAPLARRKET